MSLLGQIVAMSVEQSQQISSGVRIARKLFAPIVTKMGTNVLVPRRMTEPIEFRIALFLIPGAQL